MYDENEPKFENACAEDEFVEYGDFGDEFEEDDVPVYDYNEYDEKTINELHILNLWN